MSETVKRVNSNFSSMISCDVKYMICSKWASPITIISRIEESLHECIHLNNNDNNTGETKGTS